MINIKTQKDIDKMREACKITAGARKLAGELIRPGITTLELDRKIRSFIEQNGAKPSFLNYNGFPASACISVNDEVIHGIPGSRTLIEGDIVKVDVGAYYLGFHGDCADTFPVGDISDEAARLIEITRQSFFEGVKNIKDGSRVGDIGFGIQSFVEENGYSVVRDYIGHGVGEHLHEEPDVPNYGRAGRGPRLYKGMTVAIEPMVCQGDYKVRTLDNDWTVVTCDGSLAAHYENTVVITDSGIEILTEV
ncbi:MAG: type I methionyl aminopeptidase [Ruminococcaceae bacterium]|nr:type I methionyl aminopeptidase [Oscillospiraceae bacterium]